LQVARVELDQKIKQVTESLGEETKRRESADQKAEEFADSVRNWIPNWKNCARSTPNHKKNWKRKLDYGKSCNWRSSN
jgi:hypothetical protein